MTMVLTVHRGGSGRGHFLSTGRMGVVRGRGGVSGSAGMGSVLSFISPGRLSGFVLRCTSKRPRYGRTLVRGFLPTQGAAGGADLSCQARVRRYFGMPCERARSECKECRKPRAS